jgi:hypothetical protein
VATPEEVEETLRGLVRRFGRIDRSYKALLPNHRVVEAAFPDLDLVYHAVWRDGSLSEIRPGAAQKAHIRVECDSDDLLRLYGGDLGVRRAYATNRLRIEASMTDLLRLRSLL